jgi:ATP-dependent Lhr-like helicase
MRDLAKLDEAAVSQVRSEAWPLVRSADELHDALTSLVTINDNEAVPWQNWLVSLARSKRAAHVTVNILDGESRSFWTTAENWPVLRAAYPKSECDPPVVLPEKLEREVTSADAVVALVKGRIEHTGPTTAAELAAYLGLDEGIVFAALEALEGRGSVLRGNFIESSAPTDSPPVGWCDRRLLARIHRLTLAGLRQQIQAVEPRHYLHFLTKFHHLAPENHWGGAVGVREAISQLQGFELPAGAWEHRILAPRVSEYDPQWLDQLFMSGETVWGRLNPPRRDEDDRPSMAALTRTMPLSLLLREELSGLLTVEHEQPSAPLRSTAEAVLAALKAHGALFFGELKVISGTLPSQLEETLRELSAAGLVTSDTFAAVRKIVDDRKAAGRSRQKSRRPVHTSTTPVGRWSLFPGPLSAASREAYLETWAQQLLKRWGVLFRDVLIREINAPRWQELLPVLRLLELRGEVRGGRFVSGVAGEQYALPSAVDALREARRELEDGQPLDWVVISAADPINLFGVITDGPRIPATHRNALIVRGGRLVASRQAGVAEFFENLDEATQWTMRRAMTLGRKPVDVAAPPIAKPIRPQAIARD